MPPRARVFVVSEGAADPVSRFIIFGVYVSCDAAEYAVDQYCKHSQRRVPTWVRSHSGASYGRTETPYGTQIRFDIIPYEVKGKARVEAPEEAHMTKQQWAIAPFERHAIAAWLENYDGNQIMLDIALNAPSLNAVGVTWDASTRRFKHEERSVALTIHPRIYFADELVKRGVRGHVSPGNWWGVWMLDVAAALLALAGVEHDPTALLTPRSLRYKTILLILKGNDALQNAEDIAGEIRG